MLCEVTTTRVHQWSRQIQCGQIQCGHIQRGQIQSGEIQFGEIGCGELKCDTIEIGEIKLKCGASLNESVPSLNSRSVGSGARQTRRRRKAGEEKQWKLVCLCSSSSLPSLKLRVASFKGGFCLVHIIHTGFAFKCKFDHIYKCSIKSKLLWESEGETETEGEDSVLNFMNLSSFVENSLDLTSKSLEEMLKL